MNLTPLNYSVHAIEHLSLLKKELMPSAHLMSDMEKHNFKVLTNYFGYVADMLHKAVKFTLPDNGHLIDDAQEVTGKKFELFRLPFPIVVLEFESPDLNNNLLPNYVASNKRIALAIELDKLSPADLQKTYETFPGLSKLNIKDKVGVLSVYYTDVSQWAASVGISVVDKQEQLIDSMNNKTGKKGLGLPADSIPIGLRFATREELVQADESVAQDTGDELLTMIDFCAVMNCHNVGTQIMEPSEKLNKKRVKNGKLPMYAYHVLMLNPAESKPSASGVQGGSHASPRMHLRRGHIRRLSPERVTWVNAAIVGNKNQGILEKSYVLKP